MQVYVPLNTTGEDAHTYEETSNFALAVGFGVFLLSGFDLIAQFGALSAVTMIFALFANILVTPLILSRTRLVGLYQIWSLSVHKDILHKSPLFQGMSDYQMRKTILISETTSNTASANMIVPVAIAVAIAATKTAHESWHT